MKIRTGNIKMKFLNKQVLLVNFVEVICDNHSCLVQNFEIRLRLWYYVLKNFIINNGSIKQSVIKNNLWYDTIKYRSSLQMKLLDTDNFMSVFFTMTLVFYRVMQLQFSISPSLV